MSTQVLRMTSTEQHAWAAALLDELLDSELIQSCQRISDMSRAEAQLVATVAMARLWAAETRGAL